jgi:hypothetical protein
MTIEEVEERVRHESAPHLRIGNDHGITLKQALVPPQRITVLERTVRNGKTNDLDVQVWLIGREEPNGGYRIIMREDGSQFGRASDGFPSDRYPILCGWYGTLLSAFLAM